MILLRVKYLNVIAGLVTVHVVVCVCVCVSTSVKYIEHVMPFLFNNCRGGSVAGERNGQ